MLSVDTIPISFGLTRPLLVAIGFLERWCWLRVGPHDLVVQMSYGFRATIPRSSIRSVAPWTGFPLGIGVHGWRGRWLVNGATRELVAVDIEPAGRARVLGFPVRLSQLIVSVDDADRLVAALDPDVAVTSPHGDGNTS